jgi:hypothetical protein
MISIKITMLLTLNSGLHQKSSHQLVTQFAKTRPNSNQSEFDFFFRNPTQLTLFRCVRRTIAKTRFDSSNKNFCLILELNRVELFNIFDTQLCNQFSDIEYLFCFVIAFNFL